MPRTFRGATAYRFGAAVFAFCCVVAYQFFNPLRVNHDVALFIHAAKLLLSGRVPYVDFYEINPPMVMYLNLPIVWAARGLGLPATTVFHVFSFLLLGISSYLVGRNLRRAASMSLPEQGALSFVWVILSFSFYFFGIGSHENGEFGQREHLFILAYMPFFALRWARWTEHEISGLEGWATGLLVAVFVCLKPHFLLLMLAPELVWGLRIRKWSNLLSPEMIAVLSGCFGYGLHFALVPSAMRMSFFGRWLPFVSAHYGAYDSPWSSILSDWGIAALVPIGVLLLVPSTRIREQLKPLWPLLALVLSGLVVFIIQRKGWSYHRIPMFSATVLFAFLFAIAIRRSLASESGVTKLGRWNLFLGFAILVTMAFLVSPLSRRVFPSLQSHYPFVEEIRRRVGPGASVLFVTTSVAPAYPTTLLTDVVPGSRYLWSFPVAMLHSAALQPSDKLSRADLEAESQFLGELRDDIRHRKPRLIFIQAFGTCQACTPGLDLINYLTATGVMRSSLQEYRQVAVVEGYRLFEREPGAQ